MLSRVSIALPTYNKAEYLNAFLQRHADYLYRKKINLYIHNNASSDDTEAVLARYSKKFTNINAHNRKGRSVSYDESVKYILDKTIEEYVWIIGDSYEISEQLFDIIHKSVLSNSYDILIANLNNILPASDQYIVDKNIVLNRYCGIIACIGTTIINRKVINSFNYERYCGKQYIHLALPLDYIAKNNFQAKFIGTLSVMPIKIDGKVKTNWMYTNDALLIITKLWVEFVDLLPKSFDHTVIKKAYPSLVNITGANSIYKIALMRYNNAITLNNVIILYPYILITFRYSIFKLLLALLIPRFSLTLFCRLARFSKLYKIRAFCAKTSIPNIFK